MEGWGELRGEALQLSCISFRNSCASFTFAMIVSAKNVHVFGKPFSAPANLQSNAPRRSTKISSTHRGSAEFRERDVRGAWITRKIHAGDVFVTRSRTPYEVDFQSPRGEVLDSLSFHIAVELFLAALVELSSSHFAHVLKESTGLTAWHFITFQRITRVQQLIRATSRSLIEVGLEVGHNSPSRFARAFRRVVGDTPTEFRYSL